jgi:hypothetical protein
MSNQQETNLYCLYTSRILRDYTRGVQFKSAGWPPVAPRLRFEKKGTQEIKKKYYRGATPPPPSIIGKASPSTYPFFVNNKKVSARLSLPCACAISGREALALFYFFFYKKAQGTG